MGLRSRSYFKIQEIDEKFAIINSKSTVLDVGCSPGGWALYSVQKTSSTKDSVKVVGLDINETRAIDGLNFHLCNILDSEESESVLSCYKKFNVILSDAAPNATGIKELDDKNISTIVLKVLNIAETHMTIGGNIVIKMWNNGEEPKIFKTMSSIFKKTSRFKPDSSRSESSEIYLIGIGKLPPIRESKL